MRNNRKTGRSRYSITGAQLGCVVATFKLIDNTSGNAVAYLAAGTASGIMPPTIAGNVTDTFQQLSIIFAAARGMRYLARIANATNPIALASLFTCNGIVSDAATIDIPDTLPTMRK